MKKIIFLSFLISFIACKDENVNNNNRSTDKVVVVIEDNDNISKEITETVIKSIVKPQKFKKKCFFGSIEINLVQENDKLLISSNNEFAEDISEKVRGEINLFIETDVDGDGFNEFYCITNSGDLIAFSSYSNRSFGAIYVAQKPNYFYNTIKAAKSWEVKDKQLSITFEKADRALVIVRYHLIKGEAGFQLIAE